MKAFEVRPAADPPGSHWAVWVAEEGSELEAVEVSRFPSKDEAEAEAKRLDTLENAKEGP